MYIDKFSVFQVPFGEVKHAKDWLGVSGTVKTPQYEHPKKPILGFDCSRREVCLEKTILWITLLKHQAGEKSHE